MAAPLPVLPVALVEQELAVKENAVNEVLPNDVQEQAMDTVSKGWSKDQWISGVLERAIRIVARSAEKGEQEFRLAPLSPDSVRFSVSDDKELGTFYRDGRFANKHLGRYFPIDNVDIRLADGSTIHVQGTQRPDSISLLKLSRGNEDRKVCICFEGDAHNLDAGKSNAGMFSYEKMFQDASLCHDVNPDVPAIFITSVLFKHDKGVFPTFSDWAEQFLKEHVLLVEQLLQYISNKKTSSLHRALRRIDRDMAETREFDFFCWINAQGDDENCEMFESDVDDCFDRMYEQTTKNNDELEGVVSWRDLYGETGDWVDAKKNNRAIAVTDGLKENKFQAITIRTNVHGIPVVIFAVPRVRMSDVNALAADVNHPCSGMWYPMHVHAYLTALGQGNMNNFLVSNGTRVEFDAFSNLPKTDSTRMLKEQTFNQRFKTQMRGQLLFTLPWLWTNIGFLCKLKSSLTYLVAKGRARANTIAAYIAFTRKHATHVNSRDNVKNEMEMFADTSTSLFAHMCRARQATGGVDEELGSFLQNKCGWTNARSASSPAIFFALVGVRNLITAHTLAKRCSGGPNKYSAELDKMKDSFPLAAQVEIDYALECLCRHYYFAQDKSAVQDDVVPRAEFERMQRKLRMEIEAARAEASEEEDEVDEEEEDEHEEDEEEDDEEEGDEEDETDTSQVDNGGYKAIAGERVREKPNRNEISLDFLQDKQLVVKYKVLGPGNVHRWYRGIVTDKDRAKYIIDFDDGQNLQESLQVTNYGPMKKWVIVEQVPRT